MGVTLREIADEAGVSVRSVTRALKGEPGGNAQTCLRIREIAGKRGYVPNVAARNLRMRVSNIVGLISSDSVIPVVTRKNLAMQRRLESDGFFILSGLLPNSSSGLAALLRGWSGLVGTVVFTVWNGTWDADALLSGLPMDFIFADVRPRGMGCANFAVVGIDRGQGIEEGVRHFFSGGRKRVAFCGPPQFERVHGFEKAYAESGRRPVDGWLMETGSMDMADGYQAGKSIIEGGFDAVFFATDRMALGFYRFCHENGVRVPEDVAVIGFDDDQAGMYACPPLSTVAQPVEAISARIAELVRPGGFTSGECVFPTRFIRRESA